METTDKYVRDIKVGDYVKVVNRITGLFEDSGKITKIEGRMVNLGEVNGVKIFYYRDRVIKY